jgi:hypothetical protein
MFQNCERRKLPSAPLPFLAIGVLTSSPAVRAQEDYQPTASNLAARQAFQGTMTQSFTDPMTK